MSDALNDSDVAATYLFVGTIGIQGDDGEVAMRLLLRTPATQTLMTPDQADATAEMLRSYAAKARAEQLAIEAQPEAAGLAAMNHAGVA